MTKKRAVLAVPLVILIGVLAVALVLAVRGRGATTMDGASSGSRAGGAEPAVPGSRASALGDSSGGSGSKASDAVATTPLSRAVISTGQVTLHSKQMTRSRAEIIRLVTSWGGVVADEQSTSDSHGRLVESTLTLRIPSPRFSDAMTAFATLGDVVQQSQKSEDVTTKVIDNDARVRAAERSIRQIEALLSRAQKLGDIIAIENDLAQRQADLDSLKSQQAWLKDQTQLSTVNVYLSRPVAHSPATHEAKGFLAGLEHGWQALGGATVVVLTVIGAVLPFAVLAAAVGVPLWLVVRRRRVPPPPTGA